MEPSPSHVAECKDIADLDNKAIYRDGASNAHMKMREESDRCLAAVRRTARGVEPRAVLRTAAKRERIERRGAVCLRWQRKCRHRGPGQSQWPSVNRSRILSG